MKELNTFQLVKVPEGIDASVKARAVTVKGPRGSLTKAFKHLAVDIYKIDKDTIKVEKWFGKKKELASVRTVCSHIENMFKGVIKVRVFNFKFLILCISIENEVNGTLSNIGFELEHYHGIPAVINPPFV